MSVDGLNGSEDTDGWLVWGGVHVMIDRHILVLDTIWTRQQRDRHRKRGTSGVWMACDVDRGGRGRRGRKSGEE